MSETIKLAAAAYRYDLNVDNEDVSVHIGLDDEWGWFANVTLRSWGQKNPQVALDALLPSVERLLTHLKTATFEEPRLSRSDGTKERGQ